MKLIGYIVLYIYGLVFFLQWTHNPLVVGSNPTAPSQKREPHYRYRGFLVRCFSQVLADRSVGGFASGLD